MNLKDNYSLEGNDYETFLEADEDFSRNTEVIDVNPYDFALLAYKNSETNLNNGDDPVYRYVFFRIGANDIEKFNQECILPELPLIAKGSRDRELLEEMKSGNRVMAMLNPKRLVFMSNEAMSSLIERGRSSSHNDINMGTATMGNTLSRNVFVMDRFFYPENVTKRVKAVTRVLRVRTSEGNKVLRKVYAFLGERYIPESIMSFSKAIRNLMGNKEHPMGTPVMSNWKITHFFKNAVVTFPEMSRVIGGDRVVPCLLFEDNDIGTSPLAVSYAFICGDSEPAVIASQEWMHTSVSDGDIEKFVNAFTPEGFVPVLDKLEIAANAVVTGDCSDMVEQIARGMNLKDLGKRKAREVSEEIAEKTNKRIESKDLITEYFVLKQFLDIGDIPVYLYKGMRKNKSSLPFALHGGCCSWE